MVLGSSCDGPGLGAQGKVFVEHDKAPFPKERSDVHIIKAEVGTKVCDSWRLYETEGLENKDVLSPPWADA